MKNLNVCQFILPQLAFLMICFSCNAQRGAVRDSLAIIRAKAQDSNFVAAAQSLERLENDKTYAARDEAEVLFTRGYFYQMKALAEIDSAKELDLMLLALTKYREAHERSPRNAAINLNLALLHSSLGKPAAAISFMKSAYRQEELPAYSIFLGDLYLQQPKYDSAFYYFDLAAEKDATKKIVFERLVPLYEVVRPDTKVILGHCQMMYDNKFTELLSQALVYLVRNNYQNPYQQALCINSFIWWAHLLGSYRVMNPSPNEIFPRDWHFKGYEQFQKAWNQTVNRNDVEWWESSKKYEVAKGVALMPMSVLTEALQFRAQQLIQQDSLARGIGTYEVAYYFIAPNQEQMNFGGGTPDAFFDAAANLAIAYIKYPAFDPEQQKFRRLEDKLFSGKGASYRVRDSTAIAKFHTTLGLIYATQGNWTGGGARNGIFQLERAIAYSATTENKAPQRMLLVKGYIDRDQLSEARETLLDAAGDYLNDDDLGTATSALTQYESIQGDSNALHYRRINDILGFRKKISTLSEPTLADVQKVSTEIDKLTTPDKTQSDYFYKIQRFKMLSDVGTRAQEVSNDRAAEAFHAEALKQAGELKHLSNDNDVKRLDHQQETIKKVVRFEGGNKQGFVPQYKRWEVESSGDKKETVKVQSNVLVAAQVVSTVNAKPEETKPEIVIHPEENKVEIIHDEANPTQLKKEVQQSVENSDVKMKVIMKQRQP